jgi:hypothetical protein
MWEGLKAMTRQSADGYTRSKKYRAYAIAL